MSKKVLILSGSPREDGNSDTLCNQFMQGALKRGHNLEQISLRDKNIGFCIACYACREKKGVSSKMMSMGFLQK